MTNKELQIKLRAYVRKFVYMYVDAYYVRNRYGVSISKNDLKHMLMEEIEVEIETITTKLCAPSNNLDRG